MLLAELDGSDLRHPAEVRVHLSLNVRDLEASTRFYEALLGEAPHKVRPGYANFAPRSLPIKLALNQQTSAPVGRGGLSHLGFQVATVDEVLQAGERLRSAGLTVTPEGDTVCCFARQEKFWVHDPDGNAWEIYVLTDDMLTEGDRQLDPAEGAHTVLASFGSDRLEREVCRPR